MFLRVAERHKKLTQNTIAILLNMNPPGAGRSPSYVLALTRNLLPPDSAHSESKTELRRVIAEFARIAVGSNRGGRIE